jgi:ATP-dependent helicase/DNAse subunit B
MAPQVTVLAGPARCGKTHSLVHQYRQALQTAGGAIGRGLWLAPTSRSAAAIRQWLLRGDVAACVDPGVTTFDSLPERVLSAVTMPPRQLTSFDERTLLRRVIASALKDNRLTILAATAGRSSFVDLVREHIQELKRNGVTPPAFARAIGSRGDPRQHEELAWLYAEYERLCAAHSLSDQEGLQWAVRDTLARDASLLAQLKIVVADGFTDYTHTQLDVLGQLAHRAGRLIVSLTHDARQTSGRHELFGKSAATLAELRRRHPQLKFEQLPRRASGFPAIDHVADHLFEHPRDIPPPTAAVVDSLDRLEIVAAAGVQDEIVELARTIKRRMLDDQARTGRARPGDVVVVFRNLRSAAPRVRDVFEEFGIPYSLEAGLPLAATGTVRMLLDLLRLDAEDWPFRRVVSVVTNCLLTAASQRVRAAAEWLVRDLQIAQGRDTLLARAHSLAGELASASGRPVSHHDRQTQAAATALTFLNRLAAALDELPTAAEPAAWIEALTDLGTRLGIQSLASAGGDTDNTLAWQSVVDHLASLQRLAHLLDEPTPQLSRSDVLDLLVDLAAHESLPRRFDDAGRVRVLSATTARTIEAREVFLAGMSEQAFPSPESAGRLYSEADYRVFAGAADQSRAAAELPAVQRSQDEMLLFYEVLTRADERLTISFPALDDKAQSLPPSPYVTEVERAVQSIPIKHRRAERPSPLPPEGSLLSPTDWRIRAVHEALAGNMNLLAGLFQSGATGTANALEAALRTIAGRSRRDGFGPAEGLLESDAVRQKLARRFGGEHLWSPSQWETYAVCPYRFFMDDVLGLEPLGELVLETDHRRRGTLVHRVLAEFHRRAPEIFGSRGNLSQQDAAKFATEFENVLEALVRATPHHGVEAALVELDRRQIVQWGPRYHAEHGKYDAAWSQLDAPLEPAYFEWRFGPPRSDESDYEDQRSTAEPFLLDVGQEQIRITGRVDRIDVGESAGRRVYSVIDYKSGRRPSLSKEQIASGQRLQPALYVMAAQALLFTEEAATPLYAGYWSMTNGVSVNARFSLYCSQDQRTPSEEWVSLRGEVVEQIGHFVRDIRSGNFPVSSRDDDCTSRCEFATVCRIGQVRNLGKQWFPEEDGTSSARGTNR